MDLSTLNSGACSNDYAFYNNSCFAPYSFSQFKKRKFDEHFISDPEEDVCMREDWLIQDRPRVGRATFLAKRSVSLVVKRPRASFVGPSQHRKSVACKSDLWIEASSRWKTTYAHKMGLSETCGVYTKTLSQPNAVLKALGPDQQLKSRCLSE